MYLAQAIIILIVVYWLSGALSKATRRWLERFERFERFERVDSTDAAIRKRRALCCYYDHSRCGLGKIRCADDEYHRRT